MAKNHSLTKFFLISVALFVLFCFVWHVFFSRSAPSGPQLPIGVRTVESNSDGDAPKNVLERKAPELLALFSEPDDWRRDANLIRFPSASLYFLFKGEPNLSDDGRRMSLNACTAVYLPRARRVDLDESRNPSKTDESSTAPTLESEPVWESLESRAKRALVFEVSDQIVLNFSVSLLDYDRLRKEEMNLSLLEGGALHGQVVVRGGDETSANNPAFYVQTRDVAFNARQFRTAADVSFRFGPHYGTGEGLTIDYETPESFESRPKRNVAEADEREQTPEPTAPEELKALERGRVMARIDELVEDGNLGNGCSIRQIEINKLKDYIHFDLTALGDEAGGAETGKLDQLDVGCRGGIHFEPTANEPGQWCVRFDDDVTAIAWRQSERVCVFKGKSFYLFFQDPLIEELQTKFTDAFRELRRRNPSGALTRLKASVVRVLGGEEPVTAEYTLTSADETAPPRVVKLKAMQAIYDDRRGNFGLFNRLDSDALDSGTPDPVSVSVTEFDGETGEPVVSTLTSPSVVAFFDRTYGFKLLQTKGNGSLTSFMRTSKGERVAFQAFWENGLQLEPKEERIQGAYLLTSSGASRCVVESLGSFYSAELNFWFRVAGKFNPKSALTRGRFARRASVEDAAPDEEIDVASTGRGDDEKFDAGFAPICAKFAKDVVMDTPRGSITVGDSVVVRFSDQSGTESAAPLDAGVPKTFATVEEPGKLGLDGAALAEGDGRFALRCERLDLNCELARKGASEAGQVGKRAGLRVIQGTMQGAVSFVDLDAKGEERASLYADSVVAENPMTSAMKLYFRSEGAGSKFHFNELTLQGENVEIDAGSNSFQVAGAGDVTIRPSQGKSDAAAARAPDAAPRTTFDISSAAGALTDPITIAWTKTMTFDGQTMKFLSTDDTDVVLQTKDASVRCAETRLVLKRPVSLQNLNFSGDSAPDADYVECLGAGLDRPARMSFATRSATPEAGAEAYSGRYDVTCESVRVAAETGVFTIENQGELTATVLSEKGVAGLGDAAKSAAGVATSGDPQSAGAIAPTPTPGAPRAAEKQWVRVCARFNGATGSLRDGTAEIAGGVNALICDVESPTSAVTFGNPADWPDGALTFHCRRALYRGGGGGAAMKDDVEVEARGDVTFRMSDLTGYCESLGYAASKNLVTLAGAENSPATIERQAYSGAPRTKIAEFMSGKIRLDTKKFEVENLTYSDSLDNLGGQLFKDKDKEDK